MVRTCQLLDLLWMDSQDFRDWLIPYGGLVWARHQPIEGHHIFGGTQRIDRKANLIDLCFPVHQTWGHAQPQIFRVACLYRQKQLGKLDWDSLDFCAGRSVKGLLESKPLQGVFEKWRVELLQ